MAQKQICNIASFIHHKSSFDLCALLKTYTISIFKFVMFIKNTFFNTIMSSTTIVEKNFHLGISFNLINIESKLNKREPFGNIICSVYKDFDDINSNGAFPSRLNF